MAYVEIYSTMTCASCIRAVRLLKARGIEPVTIDVTANREPMIERSGRMTVPQIFIDDLHVGGYDELLVLDRNGRLGELLTATPGADEELALAEPPTDVPADPESGYPHRFTNDAR